MANSYNPGLAFANQTKHSVFEASDMLSTKGGKHIYAVKAHENRDNGSIIGIGGVASPEGLFVFNAKDAVAGEGVFVIDAIETNYHNEKIYANEEFHYLASGEVGRAREVAVNDIFTVTDSAITAASTAPVVGQYVYWDNATNKYIESATVPASAGSYICFCQIIGKVEYFNGTTTTAYRLRVLDLTKTVAQLNN